MLITITSIRLRSVFYFFKLSYHGWQVSKQLQKQNGFVELRNTGFGYLHYTCSVWENEAALKAFAVSGAHKTAMQQSAKLATTIQTYTYSSDQVPDWVSAKKLLSENGKTIQF